MELLEPWLSDWSLGDLTVLSNRTGLLVVVCLEAFFKTFGDLKPRLQERNI